MKIVLHIVENIKPTIDLVDNDKAWWMGEAKGSFTVKLAYQIMRHRRNEIG